MSPSSEQRLTSPAWSWNGSTESDSEDGTESKAHPTTCSSHLNKGSVCAGNEFDDEALESAQFEVDSQASALLDSESLDSYCVL